MNSRFQLIVLICTVLSVGAHAQSLSVSFPDTARWGAAIDSSAISFWANNTVTNTTANSVTVDVVRVQDATGTPGWFSEFCFQYCSQSWVDSIRTSMQPYEIVNIAVHINVSSTPDTGSVLMKYVNVNDTTEVYYQRFYASTSPVAVPEITGLRNEVTCYPQPAASGEPINFGIANSTYEDSYQLVVYDKLGRPVGSDLQLIGGSNLLQLELPAGVYTYVLKCDNGRVQSGKLIFTP